MRLRRWGLWMVLVLLACSGCATVPDGGRGWGADATIAPGWDRVREAAANAATDPHVWVPLAGAVVFRAGDWDEEVSDWAREETPLFGSQANARDWSDHLKAATNVAYWATVLATPSGDDAGEWFGNKARGVGVGLAARGLTSWTTRALKEGIGRERPDGSDDLSMPSGHSSAAAVNATLASRNLRAIPMAPRTRRVLDGGLLALTLGTGWARIEAGKHYPSDTLAGMALGNFFGAFINDAFLGGAVADADGDVRSIGVHALPDGAALVFHASY